MSDRTRAAAVTPASAVRGRHALRLALALLAVAGVAGVVLHRADQNAFYFFGDAAAHVVKAR